MAEWMPVDHDPFASAEPAHEAKGGDTIVMQLMMALFHMLQQVLDQHASQTRQQMMEMHERADANVKTLVKAITAPKKIVRDADTTTLISQTEPT